ncbi:FHA domain-containing protein [Enhygromyxa salina]|uniref:FHA domain-containing protein n=1 Tax=Enhygromyxa salina TaxID=215803 RepID=UPI000698B8C3|nr:FHA domain-containing protein [Enhygromyxa salina]
MSTDTEKTLVFRADFLTSSEDASGASESRPSEVDTLQEAEALLVVKDGPNAASQFRISNELSSIGRHPDSDLLLDDGTVSRRHAEIRLEGSEFEIIDVGSLNGTYVNREPVDAQALASGDEIQLGKYRLVFWTA